MKIRRLKNTDAQYMLEWMHDKNVTQYLSKSFAIKKIDDCIAFIDNSNTDKEMHLAIVNDNDEYMGTVSLKNINKVEKYAEFAITVRSCAMGKGYSLFGMNEILNIAFEQLQLKYIVWCVKNDNIRAVRFYEKNGFQQFDQVPLEIRMMYSEDDVLWYHVQNEHIQ